MVEAIIGTLASGMTLASLLKGCLDQIDLTQTAQHQELDVKKLLLKLNIEKCRLYTWVESNGIDYSSCRRAALDLLTLVPAMFVIWSKIRLNIIIELFADAQNLEDRYGCKQILPPTTEALARVLAAVMSKESFILKGDANHGKGLSKQNLKRRRKPTLMHNL
jgi:hypothetical protein